jgi:hypothetical protein
MGIFLKKFKFISFCLLFLFLLPLATNASDLTSRLKGRILLQVEANGEAWYLNPTTEKRSFLGRPHDAFSIMRNQGIGITNIDLGKIPVNLDYVSGSAYDLNDQNNRLDYNFAKKHAGKIFFK